MDEMKMLAYETMGRYFDMLPKTGYVNDADMKRITLFLFLLEFLQEFQGYIDEAVFNMIYKILECLSEEACVIPLFDCKNVASILSNYLTDTPVRITEIVDLRDTLKINLRLINLL